jgi:hypothetical protein
MQRFAEKSGKWKSRFLTTCNKGEQGKELRALGFVTSRELAVKAERCPPQKVAATKQTQDGGVKPPLRRRTQEHSQDCATDPGKWPELFGRVGVEIIEQASLDFVDAALYIFVHGDNNCGDCFCACRLIVIVGVGPDDHS